MVLQCREQQFQNVDVDNIDLLLRNVYLRRNIKIINYNFNRDLLKFKLIFVYLNYISVVNEGKV